MRSGIPSRRRNTRVAAVLLLATVLLEVAFIGRASASTDEASMRERGRYLALAGNCKACHTREGGEPFAGGRAFTTPFGTLYSSNITSDPQSGIGSWSEAQFIAAVRSGVRPSGEHLYPAFPYTAYTRMTDSDVRALYTYIKGIAPVASSAPANELRFPYNQRWALGIWKALFFEERRHSDDPAKSAEWNRGAYLVEAFGHCSACHSPRNFLGAESSSMAMTGGVIVDRVPTGEHREWSAPNLTSAPSGLASWPVEELSDYLKTGRNAFVETFGPMNEVIIGSTRALTADDVRSMAVYLKEIASNENVSTPAGNDVLQEGASLYDVHCGTCHLPSGEGSQDASSGARLVGNPVVQASDAATLINVILYSPEKGNTGLPKRWDGMKPFADKLSDEEVAAVASYVRQAWGNRGGAVTAEQVAKQR